MAWRNDSFKFEIVKSLGIVAEKKGADGTPRTREINLVSWNGREPKVDIREWNADHTKMSKGITMTDEEAEQMCMILHNYVSERSAK